MNWIQKFLGLDTLQRTLLDNQRELLAHLTSPRVPPSTPSPTQTVPSPDPGPPVVEDAIAVFWGDQPHAAQITRTYAKSLVRQGHDPRRVAIDIATHGTVID